MVSHEDAEMQANRHFDALDKVNQNIAETELEIEGIVVCLEMLWEQLQGGHAIEHQAALALTWTVLSQMKACAHRLDEAADALDSILND